MAYERGNEALAVAHGGYVHDGGLPGWGWVIWSWTVPEGADRTI